MMANPRTVLATLAFGVAVAIGLWFWHPAASVEDAHNAAAWLALAHSQRVQLGVLEAQVAQDSLAARTARAGFRRAQATSDSLRNAFHSALLPAHDPTVNGDSTRFSLVRRTVDRTAYPVPVYILDALDAAQRALRTVDNLVRADSALDLSRTREIEHLHTMVTARDSVIQTRDARIAELSKTTWRDRVAVTLGADYRGKPTLAVGWRIWPTRVTTSPRMPTVLPSLRPGG